MDDDHMHIDKLRQEVLSGRITYDDIVKRLTMAIETEYLKESPNLDFIDCCEDFLWEIKAAEKQRFVSVSDRYLKTIGQRTEVVVPNHSRNASEMGFAKRIMLISAAFAVLICLTQGAIHFEWFTQRSSTDEQQYIIQGHEVTLDIINKSIAEHEAYSEIRTDKWDELCDFLGFSPSIVDAEAFLAKEVHFEAYIEPDVIIVNILYETSPGVAEALLAMQFYTNPSEALFMFEQDANGEIVYLHDHSVYVASNMERISISWVTNSTVTLLHGLFEKEHGLAIVDELIGGAYND